MGSLSSSAKAPTPQQQAVYVPTPSSTTTDSSSTDDNASTAAKSREDNLLRRTRGRLGTISTGLNGFLSELNKTDKRKTLLGE